MEPNDPKRLHQNKEGKYYTTDECDGCAYCASIAPENFDFDRDENVYFVSKQPAGREEEDYVQEAMEDCPVDAIRVIGNNGHGEPTPESSQEVGL